MWIVISLAIAIILVVVYSCCYMSALSDEIVQYYEDPPCESCGNADDVTCEECKATKARNDRL